MGVNGRGKSHISSLMKQKNVQVTTLCDPDMNIMQQRQADFKNKYDKNVSLEQDLRRVMDDKDIDVVSIASPNHWHALSVIWACQAGKDVYVEKPGSHNIFEGRKMVEAAQKYGRIVQHGVQLRSSPAINEAIGLLRNGYIGNVYMARGLVFRWREILETKAFLLFQKGWIMTYGLVQHLKDPLQKIWFTTIGIGIGTTVTEMSEIKAYMKLILCMWGLDVGLPTKITSMGGKFLWDDCKGGSQRCLHRFTTI